jgi:hypothetical protein
MKLCSGKTFAEFGKGNLVVTEFVSFVSCRLHNRAVPSSRVSRDEVTACDCNICPYVSDFSSRMCFIPSM